MQPPSSAHSLQLVLWKDYSNQSDELATISNDRPSVCEIFFETPDLLRSTWEHDFRALQIMQRVSKKHNEIADKDKLSSIVRLLNEEKATFTDFGIKTKEDLAKFAEKLGKEQCDKITRLMLLTELICDRHKDWKDSFGCEMIKHFPNISHLSFKSQCSKDPQIPAKLVDEDNFVAPLTISWFCLRKLPLLESIDLSSGYHNILILSFLELIPQLKKLNLNGCETITPQSFKELSKLVNLTELDLGDCKVTDISFIKSMPNLQKLNLQGCNYIDSGFECLGEATQLTSLKTSSLKCMKYLEGLKKLEELDLSRCCLFGLDKCSDIDSLKSLTGLKKLNMQGIELSDLSFLSGLNNLEHLNLSKCCSGTILLPLLEKLATLDLSESSVTKIEVEGSLPLLRDLNLSGTQLSNINFLESMENLENLNLSGILKIRSLEPCIKLLKLKVLNLQSCLGILNLDIFQSLTSLKDLNLSKCLWVRDVNFLKNLPKLQSLNLMGCGILSSIEGLRFLPNLKFLSTDGCFNTSVLKCLRYDERD